MYQQVKAGESEVYGLVRLRADLGYMRPYLSQSIKEWMRSQQRLVPVTASVLMEVKHELHITGEIKHSLMLPDAGRAWQRWETQQEALGGTLPKWSRYSHMNWRKTLSSVAVTKYWRRRPHKGGQKWLYGYDCIDLGDLVPKPALTSPRGVWWHQQGRASSHVSPEAEERLSHSNHTGWWRTSGRHRDLHLVRSIS